MPEWRDKWIAIGLQTGETQWADFERGVRECYRLSGLDQPRVIIRVDSPMALALAAPLVAPAMRKYSRDQVHAQVGDQVRDQVRARNLWYGRIGGQFWVGGWWGGPTFVSFLTDVCGLDIGAQMAERAAAYSLACSSGCWWLPCRGFVILCARPKVISRDDRGRLHCETGPAIAWPDGWSIYVWHGVRIPAEWIERREDLKPSVALTWPNIEQRRAAAEILGWKRILGELSVVEVDRNSDPQIGTLLQVDLPDAPGSRFLRVLCGTGREFVLPVARECQTALAANAWTCDVPESEITQLEART